MQAGARADVAPGDEDCTIAARALGRMAGSLRHPHGRQPQAPAWPAASGTRTAGSLRHPHGRQPQAPACPAASGTRMAGSRRHETGPGPRVGWAARSNSARSAGLIRRSSGSRRPAGRAFGRGTSMPAPLSWRNAPAMAHGRAMSCGRRHGAGRPAPYRNAGRSVAPAAGSGAKRPLSQVALPCAFALASLAFILPAAIAGGRVSADILRGRYRDSFSDPKPPAARAASAWAISGRRPR